MGQGFPHKILNSLYRESFLYLSLSLSLPLLAMRAHLRHAPVPAARLERRRGQQQQQQQAPRATTKTSANPSTTSTTTETPASSSSAAPPPSPPVVVAELLTVNARAVANAMAGSTGIDVERASTSNATTTSSSAFSLAETALSEPADAFDSWLLTEAGLQDWVSFSFCTLIEKGGEEEKERRKPKG